MNDILEREWWLMHHLNIGYNDICEMPWDYFEWFYDRQVQFLVDEEKKRAEQQNKFI